jgi:hypothetical protein
MNSSPERAAENLHPQMALTDTDILTVKTPRRKVF